MFLCHFLEGKQKRQDLFFLFLVLFLSLLRIILMKCFPFFSFVAIEEIKKTLEMPNPLRLEIMCAKAIAKDDDKIKEQLQGKPPSKCFSFWIFFQCILEKFFSIFGFEPGIQFIISCKNKNQIKKLTRTSDGGQVVLFGMEGETEGERKPEIGERDRDRLMKEE